MTIQRPEPRGFDGGDPAPELHESGHQHGGHQHGGHSLMMLVCCIPMIVIAVLLVATGAAGSGIFVSVLLCVAMMAAMMFAMPGGHGHK
jgi:hypothetical protein